MSNSVLTYGPYNSKKDSIREYEALDIGRMFDGVITDGVFPWIGDTFKISSVFNGMKITVGSGRAWFNHTWNLLESPMTFQLDSSDLQYDRYDSVVLQIGCSELVRENKILVKTGEPGENPVPPSLEIIEESKYEYVLGYIKVPAQSNTIDESNIINLVGQESDPNGYYHLGEFAPFAYAIGDNHIGVKMVEVPYDESTVETDWPEQIGSDGNIYYYREIRVSGIVNGAIFNADLWTEGTNINLIQKQETSFANIFRFSVMDNVLKLWAYYRPTVGFTLKFVGKGINSV